MKRALTVGFLSLFVAACGVEDQELGLADETDGEDLTAVESDAADGVFTFFTYRHDDRRCPWPTCGGYWVKRVNRKVTRCLDGQNRAECYVVQMDNATGLSDLEWNDFMSVHGVVRGNIESVVIEPRGEMGSLVATEAWRAQDDQIPESGVFYRVSDTHIKCLKAPCLGLLEEKLNSTLRSMLAGITGRLGEKAASALASQNIVVLGRNVWRKTGKMVSVDQLYLRQEHVATEPLCAAFTTADGRYYAKNFAASAQAEAEQWVTWDPQVVSSAVGPGTCVDWNAKPCDPNDKPVCGVPVVTDVASDYASLCEFQKVIRQFAGTDSESKGRFTEGLCSDQP